MQIHSQHLGNYFVPRQCKNGVCIDIGGNTGSSTDIEYNAAMMFGKNARETNTSA